MNDNSTLLRTLTWNIHACKGLDGRHNVERTGQIIRRLAPDIAALQEVDLRRKSQTRVDIYKFLREQVGGHSHEAWALSEEEGTYGQVLLSRYPIIEKQVHDISRPGCEPRKILDAVIEIPDHSIRIIATHLGFWPSEISHQIKCLREIVLAETSRPVLVMGDLNAWPGGKARKVLNSISDSHISHKTYPSFIPVLALDRITCRGGAKIIDSKVVRDAWRASDHLPVIATIRISKD